MRTVARGLFRLWLVLSLVWIAAASWAAWPLIESWPGVPVAVHKLPGARVDKDMTNDELIAAYCTQAKDAYRCSDLLFKAGKNNFIAFDYKWTDWKDIGYGFVSFARLAFLPPALVLVIGAGLFWAIAGFRRRPE